MHRVVAAVCGLWMGLSRVDHCKSESKKRRRDKGAHKLLWMELPPRMYHVLQLKSITAISQWLAATVDGEDMCGWSWDDAVCPSMTFNNLWCAEEHYVCWKPAAITAPIIPRRGGPTQHPPLVHSHIPFVLIYTILATFAGENEPRDPDPESEQER